MLGFAQAGQVRVERGDQRAFVAEVDLDLAQVLASFQHVCGVGMAQRVDVGFFFDTAGFEGETEGALQRGAAHGFSGGGCAQTAVTALFGAPLSVYFGVQANAPENIGRSAVLSSVGIQGAFVTPVAENFAAPLNTNAWDVIAAYPPSIQVVPRNATWLVGP